MNTKNFLSKATRKKIAGLALSGVLASSGLIGPYSTVKAASVIQVDIVRADSHPASIRLNKTTDTITEGTVDVLTSTISPINIENRNVIWTSSNPKVVTVNDGVISGLTPGTAVITATTADGGKKANCNVTVKDTSIHPTAVRLSKTAEQLNIGDTDMLIATVLPGNTTNKDTTWTSSNPKVATVNNGIITAVGGGAAIITVTTADGSKKTNCRVTVKDTSIHPTSISLSKTTDKLNVGETDTLTTAELPSNTTNQNVTWTSSNPEIATVDSNGVITAVNPGNVIIKATTADGNKSATCSVTINPAVQLAVVSLNKTTDTLITGKMDMLTADVTGSSTTNKGVTWKSSDNSIVNIAMLGTMAVITAVNPGTAIITATTADGSASATCSVTVTDNNVVTFEDKNLEQAIREQINKPTGDIHRSDVEGITSLPTLSGKTIKDITGIENLTNLQHLNLDNNQISNISALKGLTNLQYLSLNGNQISDISALKGLTNLQYLSLNGNQISDISALNGLTNLTSLFLNSNQISDISALKGLTSLQYLFLSNNQINDISVLKGLTNLQYLSLGSNQISDADKQLLKNVIPNCNILN
jgi:uncharacterized protein YjdB